MDNSSLIQDWLVVSTPLSYTHPVPQFGGLNQIFDGKIQQPGNILLIQYVHDYIYTYTYIYIYILYFDILNIIYYIIYIIYHYISL